MATSNKLYGDINIFPAIWPVVIWFFAILAQVLFAEKSSDTIRHAIDAMATIFTYGALVFPIVSYATFKYLILPALNYLPRITKNKSYFFNCIVILILTELFFFLISMWSYGFEKLPLQFASAAIPVSVVAINCAGHLWFLKRQQNRVVVNRS